MGMDAETFDRFRRAYWRVARQLDTVRLRQWEQSQVTLPQLRVLFQVRRTPGITTGELSRTLGITVSTTSGLVIKLVERGLIARQRTAEDRRQAPLFLTDAAASLVGELSDVGRPFLRDVAESLGDDLGSVAAALERLAAAGESVRAAEPEEDAGADDLTTRAAGR
jgi:DNA-binding MarR family transcriptional regulator